MSDIHYKLPTFLILLIILTSVNGSNATIEVISSNICTSTTGSAWTSPEYACDYFGNSAHTSTGNAIWYGKNYNINIPGYTNISVTKVNVTVANAAIGSNIDVTVSWDGGATWAAEQNFVATSWPTQSTTLEFTSATSWTVAKTSNANFIIRLENLGSSYVDYVQANIYYQYATPTLYTPLNQSTISTPSVSFTWDNTSSGYQIQVSNDSTFVTTTIDISQGTRNYTTALPFPFVYYWRVRDSISGEYSNWSNISNFTLNGDGTATISGQVYEVLDGISSPVSQATVFIYNTTWSSTQTTSTSGYYSFNSLGNDTYYLQASAFGYDNSYLQTATTNGSITITQNILLKPTQNTYVPTDHYVKFIVQTLWGTKYPNVVVSAFKGSDVIASKSDTTGTDGSVSLLLLKEQSYRITAVNASLGINTEIIITPHETEYYIIVTSTVTPWWDEGSQTETDNIDFVVTSSEINATHAYINATYNDSLIQTTAWTIYLNQSNTTNGQSNQTTLQSSTGSGNATVAFIVTGYTGKNYLVNLVATHTTFGTIRKSYGVGFKGLPGGELDFIPNILKAMIAIGLLIFVAAMFGQTSKSQGAGVVCVVGWILLALGFFAYFDTLKIAAGLTIATIFAVIVNMSERNKQEGMT